MLKITLVIAAALGAFGVWAEVPAEGAPEAGSAVVEVLPELLDLQAAQEAALRSNPTIEAALTRVEQAAERVKQAVSAYFPQVDASASVSKTWLAENDHRAARNAALFGGLQGTISQVPYSFATGAANASSIAAGALNTAAGVVGALEARGAVDDSVESYRAGIQATWLLFDGFGREFRHAAAKYNRDEFRAAHRDIQRQILQAVAEAFYNVQLQRENILIVEADKEFNERLLKEAQARKRVGTGSLSDELNFEVRVREAQSNLLAAQRSWEVARIGLASLMGIPESVLPDTVQVVPLGEERPEDLEHPGEADELIARAFEGRPDLAQDDAAEKRTKANVGVNRAAFAPTVSAFASRDSVQDDAFRVAEEDFSTTAGVQVSYTLFAGGRNRARYAEAKAAYREAQLNRAGSEITATAEVRQSLEEVTTAQEQLKLQRENASYVQRNRDLVEKEYAAGQTSLVRLNEAQRDLLQAQVRLAASRVALRRAWHALRTATGETVAATDAQDDAD